MANSYRITGFVSGIRMWSSGAFLPQAVSGGCSHYRLVASAFRQPDTEGQVLQAGFKFIQRLLSKALVAWLLEALLLTSYTS